MRLTHAAWAHQQQALLVTQREFRGETLDDQLCLREAPVPRRDMLARNILDFVIRLVACEIAVAITLGDARFREGAIGAVACGAIARNRPDHFGFAGARAGLIGGERLRAFRRSLDNLPA